MIDKIFILKVITKVISNLYYLHELLKSVFVILKIYPVRKA